MKIYQIIEMYDADGGFGDAIPCDRVCETFINREDAEACFADWNDPHIYDSPYADLECQSLYIREIDVKDTYNKSDYTKKDFSISN